MIYDDLCHFVSSRNGYANDRILHLKVDDIDIRFQLDSEQKYLYLYSSVAYGEVVLKDEVLLFLGKVNLFLQDKNEGHLALNPSGTEIVYSQRLDFEKQYEVDLEADIAIFKRKYKEFVQKIASFTENNAHIAQPDFDVNTALSL